MRVTHALIRIGPELGAGPRKGEVDIEENGAKHTASIGRAAGARLYPAA
jgi:hypothetical protein